MNLKYLGGPKNNGHFSFIDKTEMFHIGNNHRPMTCNTRERFLNSRRLQKGRKTK